MLADHVEILLRLKTDNIRKINSLCLGRPSL